MMRDELALALDPALFFERAVGAPPDPWQAAFLRSRSPRSLLLCSRQSGKSTVVAAAALHELLYRPGSLVLCLAPSWRQSGELFRKAMSMYLAMGQPVKARSRSAAQMELENGSRLVSLPGEDGTVRSFSSVSLLLIDEAARVNSSLYHAVRPMLAVSGGRLVALSTPWATMGWFYESWQTGEGWERVKVTASECPRITPAFLAEERRDLPRAVYEMEYLCEFRDPAGSVFSAEDIARAVSHEVEPLVFDDAALDESEEVEYVGAWR